MRIQCPENPRVPPEGSSTGGESGPKVKPKGAADGQQAYIPVPLRAGDEGRSRLGWPRDGISVEGLKARWGQ